MSGPKFTNALAGETSPYLLQHSHNPVQWFPWSEEALWKAKKEGKPILLSIGYSACHWCHVMERESFEDEAIAGLMNRHFVNIKVDREERPDLDSIYMAAVQMMTGGGGWPMTVFLTPDQIPFFGGTYFPPEDRHGMPGFPKILESVAKAYAENKDRIRDSAGRIAAEMQRIGRMAESEGDLTDAIPMAAAARLAAGFDRSHGGFGGAPKFPPSMALQFLMRYHWRTGDAQSREIADLTLRKMAWGGIYDQLGGGFHRYSVDAVWLVPHFEKMLYDNALLANAYLEAYLLTGEALYRRITEETLNFVLREMTSPEGGFFSTLDADSENHEGKFYTWEHSEVESLLGKNRAEIFCLHYDISPAGNFEGVNILHIRRPPAETARLGGVPEEDLLKILREGSDLLFAERDKRVRPARDEKILGAWNGLMMKSFAEAGAALSREDYRLAAVRNARFILERLRENGRLLRSYKDGRARFNAYLEDYAFLANGLLSLYEATFDPAWITEAEQTVGTMVDLFHDPSDGGFFLTSADHESLIHRPKEYFDNALPSGNTIAAHALLRLWRLTGDSRYEDLAVPIFRNTANSMASMPVGFGSLLCALDSYLNGDCQIAVAGDPDMHGTKRLLKEVFLRYIPGCTVVCGKEQDYYLLQGRPQVGEKPTAYVCRGSTCSAPVTGAEELGRLLDSVLRETS